ncbi:MAG: chemotaxis protein CheA [Deltaproteobacteria bacterium]|nr:chemotaxis protein CheA [Deltaproteobacteria bacterium]
MDTSKYRALFVSEAAENLRLFEKDILELERSPTNRDAIDRAFREIHSIKGMSASMGFEPIVDIAHKMEDLMDQFRRAVRFDPGVADLLTNCIDTLGAMIQTIEQGGKIEATAVAHALVDALTQAADLSRVRIAAAAVSASDATTTKEFRAEVPSHKDAVKETSSLGVSESSRQIPAPAPDDDSTTFRVEVRLRSGCAAPAARAFLIQHRLAGLGEITDLSPSLESLRAGQFRGLLTAEISTERTQHEIESAVRGIHDVEIAVVSPAPVPVTAPASATASATATATASAPAAAPVSAPTPALAQTPVSPTPDRSIRVRTEILDRLLDAVGELLIAQGRLRELARRTQSLPFEEAADRLDVVSRDINDQVRALRMVPLSTLFDRLPRVVRDVARRREKQVEIQVAGADIEVDRSIVDAIDSPLLHVVRNAVDHGVEAAPARRAAQKSPEGCLSIDAHRLRDQVLITVSDDGAGIDPNVIRSVARARGIVPDERLEKMDDEEIIYLVCMPGFSTAATVTDTSGRGVGMDIVRASVEAIGGSLEIVSRVGLGTTIRLRLPLTVATIRVLLVRAAGETFAIPLGSVGASLLVPVTEIERNRGNAFVRHGGGLLPVVNLARILGLDVQSAATPETPASTYLLLIERETAPIGVAVDEILRQEEVVVKPLGSLLGRIDGLSGATILGTGRPTFILDVPKLSRYA